MYIATRTLQHLRHIQLLLDQLQPEASAHACTVPGSPKPHGSIIVFPGSFNPPTTAHLALLRQASQFAAHQAGSVSSVLLYAAFSKRTVDKERVERPLLLDRIHLLEIVLKHRFPHVGILLFNRGLYVEQAQAIYASFPGVRRLFFLMGFDKIVQILDPRYYVERDSALAELFGLAELLVAPRGADGEEQLQALIHQPQNEGFARFIHALPLSAQYRYLSSTDVRSGGKQERVDTPREVRQFMRETRAYAPPLQRAHNELDYYGLRVKWLQYMLKSRYSGIGSTTVREG